MAAGDSGKPTASQVIWLRERPARRGPRPAYTLAQIAQVAVDAADNSGIEAVSIRRVAKDLGAGAASLYRYIESKQDLFDLMVDAVSADYDLPAAPSGDWRADVSLVARRGRVVHGRHPWALALSADAAWGPHVQTYLEFFLAALQPTGLELPAQLELIASLNAWVGAFAGYERGRSTPVDPGALAPRVRQLQQIAADAALPHLAAAVTVMLQGAPADSDPDRLFEVGLSRLLDSVVSSGESSRS